MPPHGRHAQGDVRRGRALQPLARARPGIQQQSRRLDPLAQEGHVQGRGSVRIALLEIHRGTVAIVVLVVVVAVFPLRLEEGAKKCFDSTVGCVTQNIH